MKSARPGSLDAQRRGIRLQRMGPPGSSRAARGLSPGPAATPSAPRLTPLIPPLPPPRLTPLPSPLHPTPSPITAGHKSPHLTLVRRSLPGPSRKKVPPGPPPLARPGPPPPPGLSAPARPIASSPTPSPHDTGALPRRRCRAPYLPSCFVVPLCRLGPLASRGLDEWLMNASVTRTRRPRASGSWLLFLFGLAVGIRRLFVGAGFRFSGSSFRGGSGVRRSANPSGTIRRPGAAAIECGGAFIRLRRCRRFV